MDRVEIRRFAAADQHAVVALWTAVFGYAAQHNDPVAIIRHKLELQPELFFIAHRGPEIVGTVMGGYDGHRGWIYSLAVSPDHRRQSFGSSLVRHVERKLANLGCPKINLQVIASNAAVVSFYQKLGYAVEDRVSMGKIMPRE